MRKYEIQVSLLKISLKDSDNFQQLQQLHILRIQFALYFGEKKSTEGKYESLNVNYLQVCFDREDVIMLLGKPFALFQSQ